MSEIIEIIEIIPHNQIKLTKEDVIKYLQNYYSKYHEIPNSNDEKHRLIVNRCKTLFGGWKQALNDSNIPLRGYPSIFVNCIKCNKKFKKRASKARLSPNHYCSKLCSAFKITNIDIQQKRNNALRMKKYKSKEKKEYYYESSSNSDSD
jgi:hypothetical protein